MPRPLALIVALAAAALLAAACGSSSPTTAPVPAATPAAVAASAAAVAASAAATTDAPAAAATCEVKGDAASATVADIANFSFSADLTVKAGAAIAWANKDGAPHSVTFDDGSCTSGTIAGGATIVVTYLAPGTYPFHCAIHGRMKGTLTVTG